MKTASNTQPSLHQVGRVTPCAPPGSHTQTARSGLTRPTTTRLTLLLVLNGLLLGALNTGQAATLTVTNLADSGPGSLRQTIADAAPGDTIDFAVTGTIALTSGELVITNDLTITGPGATNLTVSGNNASRVFSLTNVTSTISGLTVANGMISGGRGGGINNKGGSLTVGNCTLTGNNGFGFGGAIYNFQGVVTIVSSIVCSNSADGSSGYGGGLHSSPSSTLNVINSAIFANGSYRSGGGIWSDGLLRLTNSTVSGNRAYFSSGGGVALQGASFIASSTICSNIGSFGGGGVVIVSGGPHQILNSIIARNQAGAFPDCWSPFSGDSFLSLDFNLIGNNNGATITGVTTHNIYGVDPLLGPLADNGGPTPTHALLPGSPAIDHGSSGGLTTDQRGLPRPFNFPAYFDAADASDIGAVEMQEGPQPGPVFTVNSTNDVDDGVAGIAHCSLREAIAAANANADTNTIDFAAKVPGVHSGVTGTITLTNGQLTITNSVNIAGPGAAKLTVSGNNASRVFSFDNVTAAVSGLTVANGKISSGQGAGVKNSGGGSLTINNCSITANTNAASSGGGIFNDISTGLKILYSCVSANVAAEGGGILNLGTLDIVNSTLSSNRVSSGPYGGGIYNLRGLSETSTGGILAVTNSTISGNSGVFGGGVAGLGDSTNIFDHCTVTENAATEGGGFYSGTFKVFRVGNCIVAGNAASSSGPDRYGTITSDDYNLIQNPTAGSGGIVGLTAHNIYNQDPKLGPLADLGGPTPTHALRFDSPALDAGHSGGLTTDQRGLPRPIDDPNTPNAAGDDGSDIGAYEADPNLRLAIEEVGADIRLRFNTLYGRTYEVESKDEITNGWSVLSSNLTGSGSSVQAVDTGAANLPHRFYRGVMLLP